MLPLRFYFQGPCLNQLFLARWFRSITHVFIQVRSADDFKLFWQKHWRWQGLLWAVWRHILWDSMAHPITILQRKKSWCMHTCQLSPIKSESPYFGRHFNSPSLFCQKWPNLPILRASPYFCWIFKIFPLNHIKFSNISPMEIVITFEACTALLKKSVENGHFRAFSPMKFSKSWQVCLCGYY